MAAARVGIESRPPVVLTDEALVDRLRHGEAAAGEELVKRYAQPLLRYLQKVSGSTQLAEELHQQTWTSVLEHIDRFDAGTMGPEGKPSGGGFKAWVYRIATNKANDHWRSRGRDKSAREGLKLVVDEVAPDASHRLEGTEQTEKLKEAIEQLPESQKQVLLLRYYSGLKFVEIANTLGCPLNTALGRMHKAMIRLKQLMES